MAERVDLDELEAVARSEGAEVVLRVVAELRAARGVVEAVRPVILNPHDDARVARLHERLVAYDQAGAP